MGKRAFLSLVALILVVAGLLPVLVMVADSLTRDGRFSLAAWQGLLASRHQWYLLAHSLSLAALVSLFATVLGAPLGILLGKTDLPLRRGLGFLFAAPLLIPPYITALSWAGLLGNQGLLRPWFGPLPGRFLFGLPGCVWVLTSTFLAIPLGLTWVFLRGLPPNLEEAGRLSTGWAGVLRGISLPLLGPGVALAAVLVFLLAFGEFGVPAFLRYPVFPVESFTQFSAFYDFKAATAGAIPLLLVPLAVLALEARLLPRGDALRQARGAVRPALIALGRWRLPAFLAVGLLLSLLVFLPLMALVIQAGAPSHYAAALARSADALGRSVLYAAAGATLLTLLGFYSGWLIHRRALPGWRALDALGLFLFTLPGTVVGMGLIGLWNNPATNWIYATPVIVVLGYVAKYNVLTTRITRARLAQIPLAMEEAAAVAGAGWWRRMHGVTAPLARPGLLAGWLMAYLFALRDTGITLLVYPPGQETLPVRIFTLMANGAPELIAALCLLMILTALVPAVLLALVPRLRGRWRRSP